MIKYNQANRKILWQSDSMSWLWEWNLKYNQHTVSLNYCEYWMDGTNIISNLFWVMKLCQPSGHEAELYGAMTVSLIKEGDIKYQTLVLIPVASLWGSLIHGLGTRFLLTWSNFKSSGSHDHILFHEYIGRPCLLTGAMVLAPVIVKWRVLYMAPE